MTKEELDMDELTLPQAQSRTTRPPVFGVFSTTKVSIVGTGTTKRRSQTRQLWFADQREDAFVEVQELNINSVPSGPKIKVAIENFIEAYDPEPEYYQSQVYPKMCELNSSIKRAEGRRQEGALYSAEHEFGNALNIDIQNVRANFGLGLTYMEMGRLDKADDIFQRLVGLEATFAPEHKHLFNEFGISLRKFKLTNQSVEYYSRALDLADGDEHLHYNVARAHYDHGDIKQCRLHLSTALDLKSDFPEAQEFMKVLDHQAKSTVTKRGFGNPDAGEEPSKKCYVFNV